MLVGIMSDKLEFEKALKKASDEIRINHPNFTHMSATSGFNFGSRWARDYEKNRAAGLVEAVKYIVWIDKCNCDPAYTERNRHEPNTICGELDNLREALKKYKGDV